MRERKEKPIVRALALVLAVFLACNLLPTMPRTTQAGEGDEGPAFTFTLVNGETALNVSGSYALKQGEETVVSGSFANGTATVAGFEEGSDYSLIITFEKGYAFDSNSQVFYKQPEATALSALVGGTNLSVTCEPYTTGLIVTGIVKAGEDPLVGAAVEITEIDGHALTTPLSATTGEDGTYTISVTAPEGVTLKGTVKKTGYISAAIGATLSEGASFDTVVLTGATVTFAPGANGKIFCGDAFFNEESEIKEYLAVGDVYIEVKPENGYQIASVTVGSISVQITDVTYYEGTFSVYDNMTIAATFVKKDATPPVLSFGEGEDNTFFHAPINGTAWGSGSATKIRLTFSDQQGEGEAVSGVSKLYVYQGDLGEGETSISGKGTETNVSGLTYYDVTVSGDGSIYMFQLSDGAGLLSPILRVTIKQDSGIPYVNDTRLSIDETNMENTGISESANGYSSTQTMYLSVGVGDEGGSGAKLVTVYRRSFGSAQEFTAFGSYEVTNDRVSVPLTLEQFSTLTELALSVTDKAGNVSETKTLAGWDKGLTKSAVIISQTAGGPKITATPDAEPIIIGEGADAKDYYTVAPSYNITLTDPAGEDGTITNLAVTVN